MTSMSGLGNEDDEEDDGDGKDGGVWFDAFPCEQRCQSVQPSSHIRCLLALVLVVTRPSFDQGPADTCSLIYM